jgi:hypothetical protein
VVNPNSGKTNLCVSCWFTLHLPHLASLASTCYICGSTWVLVSVKCRHSISIKELTFAKSWRQFWAVRIFRCTGAGPEYPEISLESPDFPETPGKSPEYPGLTDKIVLSW